MTADRDPRDPVEDDDVTLPEEDDEGQGTDAGPLDDEGGNDTEAGQEPEDAQGQERVAGRAARRVQALRRETQEANDRAARLERELEQERARYRQPPQPQEESDEAFNARISLLDDPEKRILARIERSDKRHQREMVLTRMAAADAADKAAFQAKAEFNPRYKKYAPEVEQLLAEERRQGRDFPRETVLAFVLGKKVMDNPGKEKQRERGRANVQRQQARADSGRSDVSGSRSRTGQGDTLADLEKRLEGRYI